MDARRETHVLYRLGRFKSVDNLCTAKAKAKKVGGAGRPGRQVIKMPPILPPPAPVLGGGAPQQGMSVGHIQPPLPAPAAGNRAHEQGKPERPAGPPAVIQPKETAEEATRAALERVSKG